jgi:hypothetical protein
MATGMNNPYLPDQAQAITNQVNQNLLQNVLPQLRRGSVASGAWGNSGAGTAQGIAAGNSQQGLSNSLSNLYGTAWESDAQRQAAAAMQQAALASQQSIASMQDATNRYGLGNQFTLGQGQLALGNKTADQTYDLGNKNIGLGYYTAGNNYDLGLGGLAATNRNLDLQQNQQGYNQFWGNLQNQMGMNAAGYNTGLQQFNEPVNAMTNYANTLSPFTGLNTGTTTQQPSTGGGIAGAAGGALTMAQLLQLLQNIKP